MSAIVIRQGDKTEPYLVPYMPEDAKKLAKLKAGIPQEITIKVQRDIRVLRHMWAVVNFVQNPNNCPERWGNAWPTPEALYQWLKIEVGYYDIIGKGEHVYKVPRPTNFTDQKSEEAFQVEFVEPAMVVCMQIMGYDTPYELTQASIEWSTICRDAVFIS